MPSLNHVHVYKLYKARTKGKKITDRVYMCSDPDCSHYTTYELVLNKRSRCNICGEEFILDRESLKRVRPKCLPCSDTKKGRLAGKAQDLMTDLFSKPPASLLQGLKGGDFDIDEEQ